MVDRLIHSSGEPVIVSSILLEKRSRLKCQLSFSVMNGVHLLFIFKGLSLPVCSVLWLVHAWN